MKSPVAFLNSFSAQGVAHLAQRLGGFFFSAEEGAAVWSAMGIDYNAESLLSSAFCSGLDSWLRPARSAEGRSFSPFFLSFLSLLSF